MRPTGWPADTRSRSTTGSRRRNSPHLRGIILALMTNHLERREFGKALLGTALSAAAQAQQKPHASRPWPPGIKISVQMPGDPSDEDLQFVNQLGARYVNIWTRGDTATYENFVRLKNKVETAGLLVWNIGNTDVHNMEEVPPTPPARDKKIEQYKNYLRNVARA